MQDTIITLREQLRTLQLDLLTPVELTDRDCMAVLSARAHPTNPLFLDHIPFVVARFKEAAHLFGSPTEGELSKRYGSDINEINKILFETEIEPDPPVIAELRCFTIPRNGSLHTDNNRHWIDGRPQPYSPFYISRIEALPVYYVSGKDRVRAEDLIKQKSFWSSAQQELCDLKILVPLELGDVALMFATNVLEQSGTLHCSSPDIPSGGIRSGFFHAFGKFNI